MLCILKILRTRLSKAMLYVITLNCFFNFKLSIMNKLILLTLFTSIISLAAIAQTTTSATDSVKVEDIRIVRNPQEVVGMVKCRELESRIMIDGGSRKQLRDAAIEEIKKSAQKVNTTVVLITKEEFITIPYNIIHLKGTGYKTK